MVLKTGSISPSNQIRTCAGGVSIVYPTRGSEWSGNAWGHAADGVSSTVATSTARRKLPRKRRPEHTMERRPRKELGRDVIEIEVDLPEDAHIFPGARVDRDLRLHTE